MACWTGPPWQALGCTHLCQNTRTLSKRWILQDYCWPFIKRLASKCEDAQGEGRVQTRGAAVCAPSLTLARVGANKWPEISSVGEQFKFTAEETLMSSNQTWQLKVGLKPLNCDYQWSEGILLHMSLLHWWFKVPTACTLQLHYFILCLLRGLDALIFHKNT